MKLFVEVAISSVSCVVKCEMDEEQSVDYSEYIWDSSDGIEYCLIHLFADG